jgi:hypothetical protein
MTTHEVQSLDLVEFHNHMAEVYEAIYREKSRMIREFENLQYAERHAFMPSISKHKRKMQIHDMAAHRLERWARKQILLKYSTL